MRTRSIAVAGLLAGCGSALAQLDPGDVIIQGKPAGQIETGFEIDGSVTFPVHVFTDDFGDATNFSNDPGFDSLDDAFSPGTVIEINLNRALHVWNGKDFWPIAEETTLTISKGPASFTSPPCDQFAEGIPFGVADASGKFHHHPNYVLNDPAEPGIYLIEVILTDQSDSLEPSEEFWIIFDHQDDPEELIEAEEWVLDNEFPLRCRADANADGTLNVLDFVGFQTLFGEGDLRADLNTDCELNVLDFVAFQAAFAEGCD